jgi:hypothetical protein
MTVIFFPQIASSLDLKECFSRLRIFGTAPHLKIYPVTLRPAASEAIVQIRQVLESSAIVNDPMKGFCNLSGSCLNSSLRVKQFLRLFQIETQRISVKHSDQLQLYVQGAHARSMIFHYFLIITATNERPEIIIDPTYLQFLNPKPNLNPIFVGTRNDLINIFTKYHKNILRVSIHDAITDLPDDPAEFIDHLYGYNEASRFRNDEPAEIEIHVD